VSDLIQIWMVLLTQSSELTIQIWQCKNFLMKYVGHKIWNTNKFLLPPTSKERWPKQSNRLFCHSDWYR